MTDQRPPVLVVILFMALAMAITGGIGIAFGLAMVEESAYAAWLNRGVFPVVLAVLWACGNFSIYRILTTKELT